MRLSLLRLNDFNSSPYFKSLFTILTIFLLLVSVQLVHGQDNPSRDGVAARDADSNPFGTSPKPDARKVENPLGGSDDPFGSPSKVADSVIAPLNDDPELKAKANEIDQLIKELAVASSNKSADVAMLRKQLSETMIAYKRAKTVARMKKGVAEARKSQDVTKLEQQLEELMNALEYSKSVIRDQAHKVGELGRVNESLTQKINALEVGKLKEGAKKDYSEKAYMELLAELLASKDESSQLVGLDHIYSSHFDANEEGLAHLPVNNNVLRKIRSLIDSDNQEVRKAAIRNLILIHPATAREMGYQTKGYWRAVTALTLSGEQIERAFSTPTSFAYDKEPLADIVEEVRLNYGFEFVVDESVDPETLLTIDLRGLPLATALDEIAEKLGLVVCKLENMVKLLPPSHPHARTSLTYNVGGLLTDNMTLDQLEKHVGLQLGENSKVWKMGRQMLVVDGTVKEQRKASVALGALSLFVE